MPPDNYKSVTITEDLYYALKRKYENEKGYWFNRGIRSFSSFVAFRLSAMLEEETQHKD